MKAKFVFFCVLLLASCKSTGVITSLDDLTAHVQGEGLFGLKQQKMLSLSGLIPDSFPGAIYRHDRNRSPFTAIGISTVKADSDDESNATVSYTQMRTIACNGKEIEDLVLIRNQLVEVRRLASKLIRLRVERLAAKDEARDAFDSKIYEAQRDFDDELKAATESLDTEGLMVLRAETSTTESLSTKIGAVLGLRKKGREDKAGFALLAGLRTSFLFVGTDIKESIDLVTHDWTLIGRKFPYIFGATWCNLGGFKFPFIYLGQKTRDDFYIVTSRLEAKHILYAQDSTTEREVQANLKATIDGLKGAGELIKAEELQIDAVLSAVESLGSIGVLGEVSVEVSSLKENAVQYDSDSDSLTYLAEDEPWQTVYAIMSEIDDLDVLVSGNPRLHLTGFF